MSEIHLVVDSLAALWPAARAADGGSAFVRMANRANHSRDNRRSARQLLLDLIGIEDTLATAPITAAADGLSTAGKYWLRCDPVFLQADASRVYLLQDGLEDIAAEPLQDLVDTLAPLFAAEGLDLVTPTAGRWYLSADRPLEGAFPPPPAVLGRDLADVLPRRSRWKKLLNECQMELHRHAVNAARRANGRIPVNSVWFWGGGTAPGRQLQPAGNASLLGRGPLIAGLARLTGLPMQDTLPATPAAARVIAYYPFELEPSAADYLNMLDNTLLNRAWKMLAAGRFRTVHICDCDGLQLRLKRIDRFAFWRRRLAAAEDRL